MRQDQPRAAGRKRTPCSRDCRKSATGIAGQIIVALDGLDEAREARPGQDNDGALDPGWVKSSLFPTELGRGVFVIFSARISADRDWCKTLELALPDDQQMVLQTLSQSEIARFLEAAVCQRGSPSFGMFQLKVFSLHCSRVKFNSIQKADNGHLLDHSSSFI